jgi:hypothetical protein
MPISFYGKILYICNSWPAGNCLAAHKHTKNRLASFGFPSPSAGFFYGILFFGTLFGYLLP